MNNFSVEKAKILIGMVIASVKEFYEFQEFTKNSSEKRPSFVYKSWNDRKDNVITIEEKEYQLLARFAVDEYWFGVSETLKLRPQDLWSGEARRAFRDRVPFGFILKSDHEIYVVIRGTQTKPEWFNNLTFTPKDDNFLGKANLGRVHRGFNRIYTKGKVEKNQDQNGNQGGQDIPLNPIEKVVKETLEKESEFSRESQVYVVGHSLGAALATMAAVHINDLSYFLTSPTLYTFASPRVGNQQFANYINQNLQNVYRIINSEDLISAVPLASFRLIPEADIEEAIAKNFKADQHIKAVSSILSKLPNLDFYHVGEVIPFTLHKGSILENHIAATYQEALSLIRN